MRKCLLAMLILMLVILMLILMLLNLNTGYADTYADLCIRIMSLCCTILYVMSGTVSVFYSLFTACEPVSRVVLLNKEWVYFCCS